MKGTRDLIVELLRQHGGLTVADLAQRIGIAAPAVRRHLDILTGEAMIECRAVKQPLGRPFFSYSLTDQARERVTDGNARLLERLLRELNQLDSDSASNVVNLLVTRLSQDLAEEHRAEIRGATLEERVGSLIAALADEGILDDFEVRDDGVYLTNSACPHRRAAMASDTVCRAEQGAIAMLLGAPVQQIARIVDGRPRCEYLVAPCGDELLSVV